MISTAFQLINEFFLVTIIQFDIEGGITTNSAVKIVKALIIHYVVVGGRVEPREHVDAYFVFLLWNDLPGLIIAENYFIVFFVVL